MIAFLSITSLLGLAGIGIAIVFHEGSTIVVVLNALRLLGLRPDSGLLAEVVSDPSLETA